jgi:hypothetical protein
VNPERAYTGVSFKFIPARVEVTADTGKHDGAQLFGFERIEFQACSR